MLRRGAAVGTTTTGQVAWWTTCWLTDPSMSPANPPRPRLPTTRRVAPAAVSSSVRADGPSTARVVTGTPGLAPDAGSTILRSNSSASRGEGSTPMEASDRLGM